MTKLSWKSLALACALLWGGAMLLVGLINLAVPAYGVAFLREVGSVYPGFYNSRTFTDVLLGTVYGLVDGAIAGALFGWLYNSFAERTAHHKPA